MCLKSVYTCLIRTVCTCDIYLQAFLCVVAQLVTDQLSLHHYYKANLCNVHPIQITQIDNAIVRSLCSAHLASHTIDRFAKESHHLVLEIG